MLFFIMYNVLHCIILCYFMLYYIIIYYIILYYVVLGCVVLCTKSLQLSLANEVQLIFFLNIFFYNIEAYINICALFSS